MFTVEITPPHTQQQQPGAGGNQDAGKKKSLINRLEDDFFLSFPTPIIKE